MAADVERGVLTLHSQTAYTVKTHTFRIHRSVLRHAVVEVIQVGYRTHGDDQLALLLNHLLPLFLVLGIELDQFGDSGYTHLHQRRDVTRSSTCGGTQTRTQQVGTYTTTQRIAVGRYLTLDLARQILARIDERLILLQTVGSTLRTFVFLLGLFALVGTAARLTQYHCRHTECHQQA